jgi:hypothetical protein
MSDVAKVLNDAADLIEPEGRWTTGASARDEGGNVEFPGSPNACCWCAAGAVTRVTAGTDLRLTPVWQVLCRHVGLAHFTDIPGWNDAQPTVEPVVAALRAAAQAVQS